MKEGRAALNKANRNTYMILAWKSDQRGHCEELSVDGKITKTDLKEIGWDDEGWTHLAQVRDQ